MIDHDGNLENPYDNASTENHPSIEGLVHWVKTNNEKPYNDEDHFGNHYFLIDQYIYHDTIFNINIYVKEQEIDYT